MSAEEQAPAEEKENNTEQTAEAEAQAPAEVEEAAETAEASPGEEVEVVEAEEVEESAEAAAEVVDAEIVEEAGVVEAEVVDAEVVDVEAEVEDAEVVEASGEGEADAELSADEILEAAEGTEVEDEVFGDEEGEEDAEPAMDPVIAALIDELKGQIELGTQQLGESQTKIQGLESRNRQVQNRLMRTTADFDNFRKRTQREKADLEKFGMEKFAKEMLPVVDNLERALQHSDAGEEGEKNSLVEGVQMVLKQCRQQFARFGVVGFDSVGEKFDPQRHEAIQQKVSEEFETNTVMEEYQRGYHIHERLLRPALVVVARNPND